MSACSPHCLGQYAHLTLTRSFCQEALQGLCRMQNARFPTPEGRTGDYLVWRSTRSGERTLMKPKKMRTICRRPRNAGELPTRATAIRNACLECMGYNAGEVTRCTNPKCWLYPWRFGTQEQAEACVQAETDALPSAAPVATGPPAAPSELPAHGT